MRDFVFENKTKVYFGKEQLCHLHEEVARFGKREDAHARHNLNEFSSALA